MKKLLAGILLLALAVPGWSQTYFNIFGPANGIQKNTGATPFNTAAAATDVYGLFGCSGVSTTFLNGAGSCGALVSADIPPINLASTANGGVLSTSILAGANGGTGNGFFAVSGPVTSLKTFTFPNASATVLTTNAAVTVAQGGTGVSTLTTHGVLLGEGTGNVSAVAAMAADTLLQGQGTSADPAAVSLTNCGSSTQALSYSTSTHTFGCQTISTGGTPGGSNTQIQYNNSSAFGGASNFTYTSGTGDVAITAPTSGVALQVTGVANANTLSITGSSTTGQSDGLLINAGTNSSDRAVRVQNQSGSSNYFEVNGDGTVFAGVNGASTFNIASTGDVSIGVPASGIAFQSNGFSGAQVGQFISGSGATTVHSDLEVDRAGSTVNASFEGPNMELLDTTNGGWSLIQQSGGQTEFWQKIAGSANQVMRISPTGSLIVGSSTLTDEGSGTINIPLGYYYNNIKMPRTVTMQANCTSGGCTAVQEFGTSTSVTRNSIGNFTVTYSNAFGTAPVCTASPAPGAAGTTTAIVGVVTTTAVTVVVVTSSSGSGVDNPFSVMCAGL